jgi:hypothetical protein
MGFVKEVPALQIKHVCQSCGGVMAVHEHANYQQVKDCLAGYASAVRRVRELARGRPDYQKSADSPLDSN